MGSDRRFTCSLAVAGSLLAIMFGAVPAHAASSAAGADQALVTPLLKALNTATTGVTVRGWRTQLAPALAHLPAADIHRAIAAPVQGSVLAGTLSLPATIELSGDTTIVARTLSLSNRSLHVVSHGHALHVYPVSAVNAAPAIARPTMAAGAGAVAAAAGPIVIDLSGAPGQGGAAACCAGADGASGMDGFDGLPQIDPYCATPGEDGEPGQAGEAGIQPGDPGSSGSPGGTLTFDIPDGSPDSYRFISRGGTGGSGGQGASGGAGGNGGNGGNGGPAGVGFSGTNNCAIPPAGGNGGDGGLGGPGGPGGQGGDGGRGGDITVTYPANYDPGAIFTDASPGLGGDSPGGAGGRGGIPGLGGKGGSGAVNNGPDGWVGMSGQDGATGPSNFGQVGFAGSVSLSRR